MADKPEMVRVLRVIEYVGDRKWVEATLKAGIQGTKVIPGKGYDNLIKTAIIDIFPEVLDKGGDIGGGWKTDNTGENQD